MLTRIIKNTPSRYMMILPTGDSNDNKPPVGIGEEEVAKMGCPSLGEHIKLEVVIEESYEFKVTLKKKYSFYFTLDILYALTYSTYRYGYTLFYPSN